MKWILIVIGVLLVLVGVVWMLQGTNILTQGSMAGHAKWTFIGGALAIVGIVLVVLGLRRKKATAA